jgi:hypothetical protein
MWVKAAGKLNRQNASKNPEPFNDDKKVLEVAEEEAPAV